MTRIEYPTLDGERQSLVSEIQYPRAGLLPNLYRMMLHSPPVTRGWSALGAAIRYETVLEADLREFAICCVAALMGSEYEWHHHAPIALEEGITPAQLQSLHDANGSQLQGWQAATVAYVRSVVEGETDEETFGAIQEWLGRRELIELTALAAYYSAVSRFVDALHVGLENET